MTRARSALRRQCGSLPKRRQRGTAAVEFALVAGIGGFLLLLIGIMEFGRVLFYLNSAAEATRRGARTAVVCTPGSNTSAAVLSQMRTFLPMLTADSVGISYAPSGCDTNGGCRYVTVDIKSGVTVQTFIPFVPISIDLPSFQTTLPRESLDSTDNALCSA